MKLRQIYDILINTELKQIVVGEDEDQVIALLNLALIEVYGKFSILQEEQVINVIENVTRYSLQGNSQKVLQVFMRNLESDPLLGNDSYQEVPVNDVNCDESVFTPQPHLLHIPNPEKGRVYSVMQVVTPPYITKSNIDSVDMNIPEQFLEPILYYAAYRAYKSMNGDQQTEIGSHLQTYMQACTEVYKKGLAQTPIMTNLKLTERGYP